MKILFLGPPAAGKGTQAQLLHKQVKAPLIVMGDILREAISQKLEVGIQAEAYMKKGLLVPDEVVIKIVLNRLEEEDCKKYGFLLDGFPRTLEQAKALESVDFDKVLYYHINDEVAIARIAGRRTCEKCSAIYHLQNKLPKQAGICDLCQGKLIQRNDDSEHVMKTRLIAYHEKTKPLLDYYQEKGLIVKINAMSSVEEIFKETLFAVGLARK